MPDFHPADYAVIVKLVPGGWDEVYGGCVSQLLLDLAAGRHGRVGAYGLLIDGSDSPLFGRALSDLVANYVAA